MRIKFGCFELDTEKKYPSNSDKECDGKIKIAKMKLHCTYLLCIAALVCVWIFASTHGNKEFVEQVSFASTITSIILSVLAIIMSITGEGKTEHIKEQIETTAEKLDKTVEATERIHEGMEQSIKQLNVGLDDLQRKIDEIPGKTAEETAKKMGTVLETESVYVPKRTNLRNRITNKDWGESKNEK